MKKLIAIAMLLSVNVCGISSCEDKSEEFDQLEAQHVQDAQMKIDDEDTSEHGPD